MPVRVLIIACGLLSVSLASSPIAAQQSVDVNRVSADPDHTRLSLFYRGALRATLGLSLPLWIADDDEGFSVALAPMIELHEPPGSNQPLPNQYWRGLLSLEGRYTIVAVSGKYGVGLGLAHESDHETAHEYSTPGFLALNLIAGTLWASFELGPLRLEPRVTPMLYVLSCTERDAPCRDLAGSTAVGGHLQLAAHTSEPALWRLHPFVALATSGIVGNGLVHTEQRLSVRAGVYLPVRHGTLTLSVLGFFGHDVGITRRDKLSQLGGGVSWIVDLSR